jgi:cystathionine beta-lyase/cystathionine gamma-synthase
MKRVSTGPSTTAVHGVRHAPADRAPVSTPVYQSSTFVNTVGSTQEVLYTRYGNNPNQVVLGEKMAALEGAEAAIFLASGMGATALAHLAILRPGDHLLASEWIYGGTRRLFSEEFGKLGIEVTFVDPTEARNWRRHARKTTRAIFLETPTNPLMRVIDLEPVAAFCRNQGLALLVDSTFATPVNFRPLEHGADVVIQSATKYLNGHSDVIAGVVCGSESVVEEVRRLLQVWGQAIDPHAAWLVGMVGITLKGGVEAAERVLGKLRLCTHAPSLGGVESLVSEPRLTSHAALSPAQRAAFGIPDGFIRISLGIEDVNDIIADFEAAFGALEA